MLNGKLTKIWSHLLKKYLMENFIFCAMTGSQNDKTRRLHKILEFPNYNIFFRTETKLL